MSKYHALLLACALIAPGSAFALSCGDTVTSDVTLTADLHCTTGWTALYVPTPGVTINLNGHTLSGTTGLAGITVQHASDVSIKGPGTIKGFWAGVNTLRSDALTIAGIDFRDLGMGVAVALSQKNGLYANTFNGISSISVYIAEPDTAARTPSGSHSIFDNAFKSVSNGVVLCGMDTGGSDISGNSFAIVSETAIHLRDDSNYNTIRSNTIVDAGQHGIVLRASSRNRIETNLIEYGNIGVALYPEYGNCHHSPFVATTGYNSIDGNVIRRHATGMYFGLGLAGNTVYKNWTRYNQLHDDGVGMHFRRDAVSNGGTTNDYTGTTTPAIDENGRNLY